MTALLPALASGMATVFSWPNFLFVLLGLLGGLVFGVVPGLGGPVLLALLLPVTFGMDTNAALILLGAALGGVTFGGSVSAILINTPGTPPSAASMLDGYPLTRQGRASEALGVSATASALGAVFGLFVLVALIPVAEQIILAFSPPEFFWMSILGLVVIAVVTKGNLLKGLISGAFGLMISFVGYNGITGTYRYGFGTQFLFNGIPLVPTIIGLFAIAEAINLFTEEGAIADKLETELGGKALDGVKFVLSRPYLFVRSAALGTLIGMIPGVGGTVANFLAYIQAVQMSDDPDSFGKGNPEGVLASEAAVDAKDGGALLPTVIFGIPGSASTAVLLGGFLIKGLNPGESMVHGNLPVLFSLIIALLVSNILTSVIGIGVADKLAKLTRIPTEVISPGLIIVGLTGAYAYRSLIGDIYLAALFGFVGLAMIVLDYSRIAFIIALVLGPLMESSFLQSIQMSESGYWIFVTRPISFALIVILILALTLPFYRAWAQGRGSG